MQKSLSITTVECVLVRVALHCTLCNTTISFRLIRYCHETLMISGLSSSEVWLPDDERPLPGCRGVSALDAS